ncbi:MAG TPA: WbqC family protein [Fervidobacterium sp.]|nr:WbqC family protein [Fervidobacterium sp.]HUM44316.1 WbqC family protein [Fervidobacterium sp.]
MKVAIMQPYFLPYIGYWQLINAVDKFVVYDNIKYVKRSWINRNKMLVNGRESLFSLPLKSDSDYLDIVKRELSASFEKERLKIIRKIEESYKKAPYFDDAYPVIAECLSYSDKNLFSFIYHSINQIKAYLDIDTQMIVSSTIDMDHSLRSQDRVIAICKKLSARTYINSIGGMELYDKKVFAEHGIELLFIRSKPIEYEQYDNPFVPWLSIIDVMMFNSPEKIREMLDAYDLV